jgi:serine/threonine protein kinase
MSESEVNPESGDSASYLMQSDPHDPVHSPSPATSSSSSSVGSRPSDDWEPPTVEALGRKLPQYEFLALIGRGGMGAVYRARQLSLDRLVAIKVLPGEVFDENDATFVQRFKNEARTMGRMNHPGIVNVFDFGEATLAEGRERLLYFVMEYVEGTDVAQMVASQGRLQPDHALAIIAHVCDALAYAHANGIIHRDIKPANVLINRQGHVKVADFGLAKGGEDARLGLTNSNVALGTPDYVAPEALIMGMQADHRCDLYAVGVMLFNLLTGEIPRGMFRLPSAKMGTDPRFDDIIVKAMQADREYRYQSAAEIRQDLDQILTTPMAKEGEEGAAVPRNPEPGGRPVTRHSAPINVHGPSPRKHSTSGSDSGPVRGRARSSSPSRGAVNATPASSSSSSSSGGLFLLTVVLALIFGGWWVMQSTPREQAPETVVEGSPTAQTTNGSVGISATPAVSSTASKAGGNETDDRPYPVGRAVRVFHTEESVRQWTSGPNPLMRRGADGWLRFDSTPVSMKPEGAVGKNWGIRARFRHTKDRSSKLVLRNTHGQQYYLSLNYREAGLKAQLKNSSGATSPVQFPPPLQLDFLEEDEMYFVEFFALENRLVARVGGRYLGQALDDKISFGEVEIWGTMDIRDIEVANLDGMEEAEMLRWARVDPNGVDISPNAMLALSGEGTTSPKDLMGGIEHFPQGRWVTLFQREDQFSTPMKQAGARMSSDGWITTTHQFALEGLKARNMGIRAKFKKAAGKMSPTLRLRMDRDPRGGGYEFSNYQRRKVRLLQRTGGPPLMEVEGEMAWSDAPMTPDNGGFTLEFYAIGSRLVGLVNGRVVSVATHDRWRNGWAAVLPFENPMRDLQIINLDGLSDDEALSKVGLKSKLENPPWASNLTLNPNSSSKIGTMSSTGGTVPAQAARAAPPLPAEGVEIRQRMEKLSGERVREPYESSLKSLNSGYMSALQREEQKIRQSGKLDEVLKFQQEMKRFKSNELQILADEDEVGTPDALKSLRGTWRSTHANLLKTREEAEQALFGQYVGALQNLESDLTRQNRVDDALAVREFRVNGLRRSEGAAGAAQQDRVQ